MKESDRGVINFETGSCEETVDSCLEEIAKKLKRVRNPWTGNKRKMVIELFQSFEVISPGYDSILDLFAGSGMVSMAAKLLGRRALSNDLMTFSYFSLRAFVENNEPLSDEERDFLSRNKSNSVDDFVLNNYTGNVDASQEDRFTPWEAEFLDNYYANAVELFGSSSNPKFCLAIVYILHYVMQNCFLGGRLNYGQVLASLEHRLDHTKTKNPEKGMNFMKLPKTMIVSRFERDHRAWNRDASELLIHEKPQADICYIDPPYGAEQSDYAKMYAFFEEYIYRKPISELEHLNSSSKFVKAKDYYSHFCTLLDQADYLPILVFSYNESSWCKIKDLKDTIEGHDREVLVKEVDYAYQYRKNRSSSKEYIITAVKR